MWDLTTGALTLGVLKGEGGRGREGHHGQAAAPVITLSKIRQGTFRKQFWSQ